MSRRKKRLAILGTLLLATLALGASLYQYRQHRVRQRSVNFLLEGMAAVEDGRYSEAASALGAYVRRTGARDVEALYHLAIARRASAPGDALAVETSLNLLERVAGLDPDHLQARLAYLDICLQTQQWHEALDMADRVLERWPDNHPALRAKAVALLHLQRYPEALVLTERQIKLTPSDLPARMRQLHLLQALGRSEAILESARQWQAFAPDDSRVMLLLGEAHRLVGQSDEAADYLRRAAATPLDDLEFVEELVQELEAAGLSAELFTVLRRAARRHDLPWLDRALAARLWETAQPAEILRHLESLLPTTQAADPQLLAFKAMALFEMGGAPQAQAYIDRLAQQEHNDAAQAWALYLTQVHRRPTDEAVPAMEAARRALQYDPGNPYIRFALARLLRAVDERDLAINLWQQVAEDRPTWSRPLVLSSQALLEQGQARLAMRSASEALRRLPTNPQALAVLIEARAAALQPGQIEGAEALLRFMDEMHIPAMVEARLEPVRTALLAQVGQRARARELILDALQQPSDGQMLLDLARVSDRYALDLAASCHARHERLFGRTPEWALAAALDRWRRGLSDEATRALEPPAQPADEQTAVDWRLARARFLEATAAPEAPGAWEDLADDFAHHVLVQQAVLQAPSAQLDDQLMARVAERLQQMLGSIGVNGLLKHAQLVLNDAGHEDRQLVDVAMQLSKVSRQWPTLPEPRILLARALIDLGNTDAALDQLKAAEQSAPHDTAVHLALARLLERHGAPDEASEHLQQVLRSPEATRAELEQAAALWRAWGRSELSTAALDRAAAADTDQAALHLVRARVALAGGDVAAALTIARELLDRPNLEVIRFTSDLYARLGQRREAQQALDRVRRLGLEPGVEPLVRGDFAIEHGSPGQAAHWYRTGLEENPRLATLWRGLAHATLRSAEVDQLMRVVNQAAAYVPQDPALALLREHRDCISRSIAEPANRKLLSALFTDPQLGPAVIDALYEWQRWQVESLDAMKQREALQRLALRWGDTEALRLWIAQQYLAAGEMQRAATLLRPLTGQARTATGMAGDALRVQVHALVRLQQRDAVADLLRPRLKGSQDARLLWMAAALELELPIDEASRWLEVAAEAVPIESRREMIALAQAWRTLGSRFGDAELSKRAVAVMQPAAHGPDAPPEAIEYLAQLMELEGDRAAAIAGYRRVLAYDPHRPIALNNLAMLLVRESPSQAADLAQRAVELAPAVGSFYHTLAWAHLQAGDAAAAVEPLHMALRLEADRLEWHLLLAEVQARLGNTSASAEAISEVERLIAAGQKLAPQQQERLDVLRRQAGG